MKFFLNSQGGCYSVQHLEDTEIAESMLNDRLLGVGVKEAKMEILGGMMP
ncbi:MAG: hypothetical protein GY714_14440 [Desulfobacterales bacterium]|nr:hypothetical protein [Desulfobacterales bacterium]MCP4158534.1 hypothetical protein [Deltaproteobacteria bacterium]